MLKIFNTLTRKKEDFVPLEDKKVKFYQCGPTVYWTQHIGNMRAMVMADLIRRTLILNGYEVKFVRNYTDVGHLTGDNLGNPDVGEDKMEKGASREGLTPNEIADKYIKIFEDDVKSLNVLEPSFKPRATEYISQIISMVETLVEKGFAYVTSKAVYFDISKVANYNQLNKQKLDENLSGAGTGNVSDSEKHNPQDFALWFFKTGVHKNALQFWQSPFHSNEVNNGEGFPGWHIECSAMAKTLLGDTIDIHMGGIEHISVHHTNEIAQSESASGVKFVNYWIHNEHLNVDGDKMSKSEGTGYSLGELIGKNYDPLDLRYYFLQSHYRSKQNFTFDALDASKNALNRLRLLITKLKSDNERTTLSEEKQSKIDEFRKQFIDSLNDDFNIPQALSVVWEVAKSNIPSRDKAELILYMDEVLGLGLNKSEEEVGQDELPLEVIELIMERDQAKKDKDFERSDELRDKIFTLGYFVSDNPNGSTIKKIKK